MEFEFNRSTTPLSPKRNSGNCDCEKHDYRGYLCGILITIIILTILVSSQLIILIVGGWEIYNSAQKEIPIISRTVNQFATNITQFGINLENFMNNLNDNMEKLPILLTALTECSCKTASCTCGNNFKGFHTTIN